MPEQSTRRQKLIALILSGVFPGLGQFYTRQPRKGAAFLAAGIVLTWFLGRAIPSDLLTLIQPEARLIVPLFVLLIVWLWSIIDAWRVAGR
jgi:TM2 domain-containing membrane protein YozV